MNYPILIDLVSINSCRNSQPAVAKQKLPTDSPKTALQPGISIDNPTGDKIFSAAFDQLQAT